MSGANRFNFNQILIIVIDFLFGTDLVYYQISCLKVYSVIQNSRFMYIALPFIGFVLVGGVNTLTPSTVYAERIPFAI